MQYPTPNRHPGCSFSGQRILCTADSCLAGMDSVHARLVEALPPQLHPLPSESAAGADVWGDCGDLEPADLHSAKKVGHDNLRSAIQVLSARPVLGLKLRKSDSLIRLISNEISNHTKRARNACANTQVRCSSNVTVGSASKCGRHVRILVQAIFQALLSVCATQLDDPPEKPLCLGHDDLRILLPCGGMQTRT